MRVQAFRCGFTNLLFDQRKVYRKHLLALRKTQQAARVVSRRVAEFDNWIATVHNMSSIQEIEDWLNVHYFELVEMLFELGHRGFSHDYKRFKRINKTVKPKFKINVSFKKECSTSHQAPRGQKCTGWNRDHVPEMGWSGKIEIEVSDDGHFRHVRSDDLQWLGIHTGSGGSRRNGLGYDVTLFAKDFKKMVGKEVYAKLARP